MISRRTLIATSAAVPLASEAAQAVPGPLPVPPSGRIAFRMLRKGDVIGNHVLTFTTQGDMLTVAVAIDIVVKMGPIPVYRYMHRATERWTGDRFDGIESRTDKDGTALSMRADRKGEQVMVTGSNTAPYAAPPMALPTTYWNRAMLQSRVINSEDGRLFQVTPTALAEENVPLANGGTTRARHWNLDGDLKLDLWYDAAGQWAHLIFTKDGTTVTYEKL